MDFSRLVNVMLYWKFISYAEIFILTGSRGSISMRGSRKKEAERR
jgi:hypothetical protein